MPWRYYSLKQPTKRMFTCQIIERANKKKKQENICILQEINSEEKQTRYLFNLPSNFPYEHLWITTNN